jgi:hypothetical protein
VLPSLRRPAGLKPRKRLDHGPDCDLAFKSRQRRPQAVLRPVRETQVPLVIPGNVELIGASEPHRIAVGSSDHRCQEVARFDAVGPDFHGHRCTPPCGLNRTVESQELLHRGLDQCWFVAQTRELSRCWRRQCLRIEWQGFVVTVWWNSVNTMVLMSGGGGTAVNDGQIQLE